MRHKKTTMGLLLAWLLVWCASASAQGKVQGLSSSSSLDVVQEKTRERKSVALAIAASLLLPGTGEWYAGNMQTGRYLLMAEGSLWLTYSGFYLYGNWIRNDAREFARRHAGAQLGGKDEAFEVNLGNFMDTESYNQAKLRNREYALVYEEASFHWVWDTDANRQRFKELRIQSDQVHQNGKFVIAALVVNRIVSAFLAARSVAAYNRRVMLEDSWSIGVTPEDAIGNKGGVAIRFSHQF